MSNITVLFLNHVNICKPLIYIVLNSHLEISNKNLTLQVNKFPHAVIRLKFHFICETY
jgi:hypothetical protein